MGPMRARTGIAPALTAALGLGCIALARWAPAEARPPAGADLASPEAVWFQSLKQPHTGASCCDISDCRKVPTREAGDHWEFLADVKEFGGNGDNRWHVIPEDKWLRHKTNPTGETVVCWDPRFGVMCAIKPAGG
jgi:hypothetical protein